MIKIDFSENSMYYAGAKIPLYFVRKEHQYILNLYEADRISIGTATQKTFTNQITKLRNKDKIYITTDGLINQFGKLGQKKYTRKKFKDFILTIQEQKTYNQKPFFQEEINNWRGNFDQLDDIMIFGAEIIIKNK